MHLVLPPSADLYAQVIYAHPVSSIYAFIQYGLYACLLTPLFPQFNVLVYSIEGRHQCIILRLSTYVYTESC